MLYSQIIYLMEMKKNEELRDYKVISYKRYEEELVAQRKNEPEKAALEFFNEAVVSAQGGILRFQFESKLLNLQKDQLETVKAL